MNKFNLSGRYVESGFIGLGSHGEVHSAIQLPARKVAIKGIMRLDHRATLIRTIREVKILRHFQHENIVSLLDVEVNPECSEFGAIYLVQELMEMDLGTAMLHQKFTEDHCRYLTYQMLRGSKALHSTGILHRDLKPASILLNTNCDLKLYDFGLARSAVPNTVLNMTEYVVTRWYRAPELLLTTSKQYTAAIDIWSVGCILAEMFMRMPLFPGKDSIHQLQCTFDLLGTPSQEDVTSIDGKGVLSVIEQLGWKKSKKKAWSSISPMLPGSVHGFLDGMLTYNPGKRLSADKAIAHDWLKDFRSPEDEPSPAQLPLDLLDFEICQRQCSIPFLKGSLGLKQHDHVVKD